MTHQINAAWGAGPSTEYEQLAERFRPLFTHLREGAISRELEQMAQYLHSLAERFNR